VGARAGRGNREALYIALAAAADPTYHSVIAADAPPGAVLRLHKAFDTATSAVRSTETQFTDGSGSEGDVRHVHDVLDTSMVATRGHVEWHVNPSTRPAVQERRVYGLESTPFESLDKTAPAPPLEGHVDIPFTLHASDAATMHVDLTWDTPDDLDLTVYRKIDGHLTEVASSGNPPPFGESIALESPSAGSYVLRVANAGSVAPSFTLTAGAFRRGVTDVHPATAAYETWALTCARPDGTVLQRANVLVSRGDRVVVDLAACRRAWRG
jgi:hypothetical protein